MSIDTCHGGWTYTASPTMPTPFGELLRRMIDDRQISQARLGRLAGTNHAHISRLMSGLRMPSRDMVDALATALNATDAERHDLMHAAGFSMDDDDDVRAFRELPPAARKALLRMVDVVRGEVT